jgi:hypothetical protein
MRAEKFITVCSNDPGIDTTLIEASVFEEYLRDRQSLASIQHAFSATEPPTLFHIREIPHALWDFVDGGFSLEEKYKRAFMAGVEMATNVVQRDGSRLPSVAGTKTMAHGTGQVDTLQEKDLAHFSPAERLEIGAVAYTHSFLHRKISSCFRLPHMSHRALVEREFRSADASPISPATPSAEASESVAT